VESDLQSEFGSGFSDGIIPLAGSSHEEIECSEYEKQEGSGGIVHSVEEMHQHKKFLFLTYIYRLDSPSSHHGVDY